MRGTHATVPHCGLPTGRVAFRTLTRWTWRTTWWRRRTPYGERRSGGAANRPRIASHQARCVWRWGIPRCAGRAQDDRRRRHCQEPDVRPEHHVRQLLPHAARVALRLQRAGQAAAAGRDLRGHQPGPRQEDGHDRAAPAPQPQHGVHPPVQGLPGGGAAAPRGCRTLTGLHALLRGGTARRSTPT